MNNTINISDFPSTLNLTDVTPATKSYEMTKHITVLLVSSQIFENILYKQITAFFELIFSKYQPCFGKEPNAQNSLVSTIEKFKQRLDQRDEYAATLTYLSKAFDCLPHELIVVETPRLSF